MLLPVDDLVQSLETNFNEFYRGIKHSEFSGYFIYHSV